MWEWLFERISEYFLFESIIVNQMFSLFMLFLFARFMWLDVVVDRGTETTTVVFDVIFIVFNIFNRDSADQHSIPETYPVYECLVDNRYKIHLVRFR